MIVMTVDDSSPLQSHSESSFVFRSGSRPPTRQVWYCLGDVDLPHVRQMLQTVVLI